MSKICVENIKEEMALKLHFHSMLISLGINKSKFWVLWYMSKLLESIFISCRVNVPYIPFAYLKRLTLFIYPSPLHNETNQKPPFPNPSILPSCIELSLSNTLAYVIFHQVLSSQNNSLFPFLFLSLFSFLCNS